MSDQSQGTTRKEFLAASAGAAGAAVALAGFTRPALAEADADSMITQTAEMGLDTEKAEEGKKILSELVSAVEANEPGVLAYICHQVSDDPSKIFFFEVYKDEAALAAHGGTPHMGKMRAAFGAGILKPPVTLVKLDRINGFSR